MQDSDVAIVVDIGCGVYIMLEDTQRNSSGEDRGEYGEGHLEVDEVEDEENDDVGEGEGCL